ncbi:adenosylcobinamide-GDP ribazoletransferase [Coleofasciculus chthonoplastes]|uniref:adenosylcobinamide-GDP ribazoletransferase n=1 Tax=Coleofasciculus chthonoplastes TaxID=64178 RepID=UPI004063E575
MKGFRVQSMWQAGQKSWQSWLGAITFYTCIPIPMSWGLDFERIARWAPVVGLFIGVLLAMLDALLQHWGMPHLTRSGIIVVSWVALTGGLHLDGVMDTADGLGVQDPKRRLEVMADSVTGAFGAMAAIALLLLKMAALTDIETDRWFALISVAGWGRWGQVVAISMYPYLKATGKGAFHQQGIRVPIDSLWGAFLLLGVCGLPLLMNMNRDSLELAVISAGGGCAIALLTGFWFYRQLGGHTGDTYGAVVEWTEALLLCLLTIVV